MRAQIIAVLALWGFLMVPGLLKGQEQNPDDKTWPALGNPERLYHLARPRLIIESGKLEVAADVSAVPLKSPVRPGVIVKFYPHVLFDWHTGMHVFYLVDYKIFYLQGNCGMGHRDDLTGPFAGDPRIVLKKLAEDRDAIAELGYLTVPFQPALSWSVEAWPAIPETGIDAGKLKRAEGVVNPLSLERCRASSDECVMKFEDFSVRRPNQTGRERRVLRPEVIAHFYDGHVRQYVFYLPKQNIFYVTGHGPPVAGLLLGPFAGDPRDVLKETPGR